MILLAHDQRILTAPLTTEAAILRAVLYADVFNYPLTLAELHRYLIGEKSSPTDLQALIESSAWLAGRILCVGNFFALAGRVDVIELRQRRAPLADRLWQIARWCGGLVAHLPFVRLVAVTGALAMDNVGAADDIDFLVVTTPGRVWLARMWIIGVVRLARQIGVQLCPNYILAGTVLEQTQHDLFMAHEIVQMVPLAGHNLYCQMRVANAWVTDFLPNADSLPRPEPDRSPGGLGLWLQRLAESWLGGHLGDRLERWERKRKLEKFGAQLRQAGSAAVLDEAQVKGHFNDYGHKAMAAYEMRCRAWGILPIHST